MLKPTRPTVAEIDLGAISYNLKGVRRKVGPHVKVMAVVKANAYGHGLVEVAKFVGHRLADYFGVALPEEGVKLRQAGIEKPIHVFNLPAKSQTSLFFDYDLEPTICSFTDMDALNSVGTRRKEKTPVHLKIETGMNRVGVKVENLSSFLNSLSSFKYLEIKGVYTHFATSEDRDKSFARKQLDEFHRALQILKRNKIFPELIHCANSGAILDLPETYFSMVRAGMIMYGYYPTRETMESVPLKPAMTLKSKVLLVKWIEKGDSVSYGRRFVARRQTKIATLPVGYADGFRRALTGNAVVLIQGKRFPVVGTICMDQLMVDVGKADITVGDEGVLIGRQGKEKISAWEIAEKLGTVPYEICGSIADRVPRIYKRP